MAPGGAVSGTVSLLNKGTANGALALFATNLASPPGPGGGRLASALQLRIEDQTGGGSTVFRGALDSLRAVALGGIGEGQRRTYLITASLPAEVGNEYAAASAQVDFVWNATVLRSRAPCAAVFRGGRGGERLIGTIGGDRIRGGAGPDVIRGLAGRDCLYGGRGNDRLFGGQGDDRLYGGRGGDLLVGASGTDSLYGGSGNDRILTTGARRDVVHCGRGFDRARVDRLDSVIGCERVVRR
jgi:Ca2+-binding RTX toxin-like protein